MDTNILREIFDYCAKELKKFPSLRFVDDVAMFPIEKIIITINNPSLDDVIFYLTGKLQDIINSCDGKDKVLSLFSFFFSLNEKFNTNLSEEEILNWIACFMCYGKNKSKDKVYDYYDECLANVSYFTKHDFDDLLSFPIRDYKIEGLKDFQFRRLCQNIKDDCDRKIEDAQIKRYRVTNLCIASENIGIYDVDKILPIICKLIKRKTGKDFSWYDLSFKQSRGGVQIRGFNYEYKFWPSNLEDDSNSHKYQIVCVASNEFVQGRGYVGEEIITRGLKETKNGEYTSDLAFIVFYKYGSSIDKYRYDEIYPKPMMKINFNTDDYYKLGISKEERTFVSSISNLYFSYLIPFINYCKRISREELRKAIYSDDYEYSDDYCYSCFEKQIDDFLLEYQNQEKVKKCKAKVLKKFGDE